MSTSELVRIQHLVQGQILKMELRTLKWRLHTGLTIKFGLATEITADKPLCSH